MLNDIFTGEMQAQLRRWGTAIAPIVGFVIGATVVWMLIGQLRGDIEILRSDTTSTGSVLATERLAEIKKDQEATAVARAMVAEVTATPTPTAETITQAKSAGASEVAQIPDASPEMVAIFNKGACTGCHIIPGIPGAVGAIGPDLTEIGITAEGRQEGVSAKEYIYESLVDPQAFIAPECPNSSCPSGVMLPTFAQMLTAAELEQMVDFLVSQK